MKKTVLVIFKKILEAKEKKYLQNFSPYDSVVAPHELREEIEASGHIWVALEDYVEAGSIYEASAFAEELSRLTFPDGTRIAKAFVYRGYELWWIHYEKLYLYVCLPYTQYKKLLGYLTEFQGVHLYQPPFQNLFSLYLKSFGITPKVLRGPGLKSPILLPLGVIVQIILTCIFVPILMIQKRRIMVFTSDFFVVASDYDFRMKFVYKELRRRNVPFVEWIRSLESWKTVLQHAITRRRPVVYSEALVFLGRCIGVLTGGNYRAKKQFGESVFASVQNSVTRFKLLASSQCLYGVYGDVWVIRLTEWVVQAVGLKAAHITGGSHRNFHTVIGCKLKNITTVGIMHGVTSTEFTIGDFLPAFDGVGQMSVDVYGLWSDWWREYFIKNSKAYKPEQLVVSGLMRPFDIRNINQVLNRSVYTRPVRILFISEQLAVPEEMLPYLEALLQLPVADFEVSYRFRPMRDGFKIWLSENNPDFLARNGVKISTGELHDAIRDSDVVIGSHSTAVLEALFFNRVPILCATKKWGDYFNLGAFGENHPFFSRTPDELISRIHNADNISQKTLAELCVRFFGEPTKNGSAWVVDQLENAVYK